MKTNPITWQKAAKILLALFFFFAAIFTTLLFYTGSTKEIESVANQLQPDQKWQLLSEQVQPPKVFCVDVRCPSVHKTWHTSQEITKLEFESLVKSTKWNFKIEGDCMIDASSSSANDTLCTATAEVEKFQVTIDLTTPLNSDTYGRDLALFIEER